MSNPPITPAPLTRWREPFDHPHWLFDLDCGGFRALAHLEAGACQARLPEPQCV